MIPVGALFGLPGVGKTSTANALAKLMGASSRHCGDIVKARARELGVSLEEVPLDEHHKIDAETRNIVRSAHEPLVVEGRFLSEVLAGLPNVVLFNLTCSHEERARRHSSRGIGAGSLRDQDASNEKLRKSLYGDDPESGVHGIVIKTDGIDIDDVARVLLRHIRPSR